jgi:hypothetical protein
MITILATSQNSPEKNMGDDSCENQDSGVRLMMMSHAPHHV